MAAANRRHGESWVIKLQTIAVAGLGAIGRAIVRILDDASLPGFILVGATARDRHKAEAFLNDLKRPAPFLPIVDLATMADIVVECAPASVFLEIAEPVLQAGRKLIVLSAAALLSAPHLASLAAERGGQMIVPTGALLGLDAVTAAAEGTIRSVRMVTRKPLRGLAGAPYFDRIGLKIEEISTPTRIFSGTARDAALGFPANLNVAAALALAGIGPDRTMLDVWADPGLSHNMHSIEVHSDSARLTMTIENIPSENPKTGRITALSVIAVLRKMTSPLRVGT